MGDGRWLALAGVGALALGARACRGRGSRGVEALQSFETAGVAPPFDARKLPNPRYRSLHVDVYLRPADFLLLTSSPPDGDWGGGRDEGKVERYLARMRAKRPAGFPVPWLWLTRGADGRVRVENHEGRHRALAALRAGLAAIPVVLVWVGMGDPDRVPELVSLARGESVSFLSQAPVRWWPGAPIDVPVRAVVSGSGARVVDSIVLTPQILPQVEDLLRGWRDSGGWLYHGTTEGLWARNPYDKPRTFLHLSVDPDESKEYAVFGFQADGSRPLVLRIRLTDLLGLSLHADQGFEENWNVGDWELAEGQIADWRTSIRETGFFRVYGNIDALKSRFEPLRTVKLKDGRWNFVEKGGRPSNWLKPSRRRSA